MTPDPTKIYVRCPNKDCAKVLSFKSFPNYKAAPIVCPHCHFKGRVSDFIELRSKSAQPEPQGMPVQQPVSAPTPARNAVPAPPAKMTATVTLENTFTGEKHDLHPGENVIGRSTPAPRADVLFDDPEHFMSRCQAVIEVRQDDDRVNVLLRDAGSANGTFVNDVRLPEGTRVRISDGDTFVMGKHRYRISIIAGGKPRRMSDTILLH